MTRTVLFDGETALRSKNSQKIIRDKYNIKIYADPFFKRNLAERYIREVKLRTALHLENNKLTLKDWKNSINHIVATINNSRVREPEKSINAMLYNYFTEPTVVLPQNNDRLFRFNVNDKVVVNLSPQKRRDLNFKWTLNKGKYA